MQALREALALRQALAARPDLTPQQAVAAARTIAAGSVAVRRSTSSGTRTTSRTGRPATRRGPARKPATRPRDGRRTTTAPARAAWPARIRVVGMSALLFPAVLSFVPFPQGPGADGAALDVTTLALTARSSLLEDADRYHRAQEEVAQRQAALQQARDAEQVALAAAAADRGVVGSTAADMYRATPADRHPLLALDVNDAAATSAVLYQQALAERAERERESAVVRAERSAAAAAAAAERVAATQAAVREAESRAARILSEVRDTVDELSLEVTGRLAALGTIPAAGDQQARNEQALQRWQAYLADLAAGGIEPPPVSDIADPANLPAGLAAAHDAVGQVIPGVAQGAVGNRPVTVLPAETVAAVSHALSQLGKPFVPGTAGPESYDCGGFAAASWLLAGYGLPATPQAQWAGGAPVPLEQLQVGDLVFAPGGQDVGIYLGEGTVVGASAASYQVGVRPLAAGSTAVRVTLPAPAEPNPALPAGGGTGACGAPLPAPGKASPAWGGWANGRIAPEALCQIGVGRHALRCDAAADFLRLSAAYEAEFGRPACVTDSYRSLASQRSAFARKPELAAVPGTSNHGWGLALDLCDGVNRAGSPEWRWMTAHAGLFGFVQPDWASPGGEKPEPWHWEYGYIS